MHASVLVSLLHDPPRKRAVDRSPSTSCRRVDSLRISIDRTVTIDAKIRRRHICFRSRNYFYTLPPQLLSLELSVMCGCNLIQHLTLSLSSRLFLFLSHFISLFLSPGLLLARCYYQHYHAIFPIDPKDNNLRICFSLFVSLPLVFFSRAADSVPRYAHVRFYIYTTATTATTSTP